MNCINCKKIKLRKIVTLGKQPISSFFLKKKNLKLKKYPLDLYQCNNCNLVQLKFFSDFNNIYKSDYGYKTSVSPLMVQHMKQKFIKYFNNSFKRQKKNILDIGSNDGTFLNFFTKYKNLSLYGIDPSADGFKDNYDPEINLIIDFFSEKKINNMLGEETNKKFSLITSFAMFYDVKDPNKFCKSIKNLLDKDGIWVCEFSYFPLLLKNLTYDQICHEHVAYYTLKTFNNIVSKNGMKILDFSLNNINGGSIEVVCAKKENKTISDRKKINEIIKKENLIDNTSYKKFNLRIDNVKKTLRILINNLKRNTIYGYGASTKGNVVLNHCKINSKILPYICDGNIFKHGKYTPGSNIKIISKELMRKKKPKYLLILIWSFRAEVIKQEIDYIRNGGCLIFHLPLLHIVDKKNYKNYLNNDINTFSYDQ